MAKRKTRKPAARRKPTRRPARRAAPRRRATKRKATRRRRRRNPAKKFNVMGTLIAALSGGATGAAAYALRGQDLSMNAQAGILAAGGLVLGGLVSAIHPTAGAGIAGGGAALGALYAISQYQAQRAAEQVEGLGRIPNYGYRKFGHTPAQPDYRNLPEGMGAIQGDLGAVQGDLGDYEATLQGMQAELI